jgi:hypothetical protein
VSLTELWSGQRGRKIGIEVALWILYHRIGIQLNKK